MQTKAGVKIKLWENIPIVLFFFLASFYMITMTGDPATSMGVSVYETAESLIRDGDFALEKPTLETGIGKDGRYYTYLGLAFILSIVVFYFTGDLLGVDTVKFVMLANQIFTAIACVILFLIGRELKYSKRTSIVLSLVYGVGTMAWVHSRFLMPEPFTTVVYLAALLFLLRYKNKRNNKWLLLCGCFTGFGIIVRPDAPFFMFGMIIGMAILLYQDYRQNKKNTVDLTKKGLVFLAPFMVFFAIYAYYNYARFGDIFELGYSTKAQEVLESHGVEEDMSIEGGEEDMSMEGEKIHHISNLSETFLGFAGMWIIPCRSMFFINPVLIFIFWGLKGFWGKFRFECIVMGIIFILHVGLYSNRGGGGFSGSSAWGVRYMVPMTSFMVVVMGTFVERIMRSRTILFKVFLAVFLVSVVIQFIGVSQPIQYTQMTLEQQYADHPDYKYDKWAARRTLTMNPKWNLITQNLKLLSKGDTTDLMYYWYFFMLPEEPPNWVIGSLIVLVLIIFTSCYFLYRLFMRSVQEPIDREQLRKSKKKKRKRV